MLTIDIGNSRIKWAVFAGDDIQSDGAFEYHKETLENDLNGASLPRVTDGLKISCVAGNELKKRFIKWLDTNGYERFQFAETHAEQCAVINSYETPASMGVDRWLAMIAAFKLSNIRETETVCIIDCGTAITLDLLDSTGKHLGGLIMPGYQTMIRSLDKETGDIRVSEYIYNESLTSCLASSTEKAISNGCSQLIVGGWSAIMSNQQNASDGKMHCIVTGGDGEWVSGGLPLTNTYNPYLVLQGLNFASISLKK